MIGTRFKILSGVVPELGQYDKMFSRIEGLRHKAEHTDNRVPNASELISVLKQVEQFQIEFDQKILPRLRQIISPKDKFSQEWQSVLPLIPVLQKQDGWGSVDYSVFKPELEELKDVAKNLSAIEDHKINDYRVKLRDLQIRLLEALSSAEADQEFESFSSTFG
jgi:hypothetical protein